MLATSDIAIDSRLPVLAGRVSVVAVPHPLKTERIDFTVEPGMSLAEIFELAQPDDMLRLAAHIYVGDNYVPRQYWRVVYPKAGALISVRAFVPPHDGDLVRSVLLIAVAGAALAFGGPLAAGIGLTGAFGVAVGQAVIGIGGMLLVNALIPPRGTPSASGTQTDQAQTLFIENAQNSARPFDVVAELFGEIKVVPDLAADWYTEIVGDDQYLIGLLCWGIGPMELPADTMKIGETLLSEFDDVQVEHREGYAGDDPVTLYPAAVVQDNFQITLLEADGYALRTSGPNADRIGFDVLFPEGLIQIQSDGTRSNRSVAAQLEYSVSGANDWHDIPAAGASTTFPIGWSDSDGTGFSQVTFTQRRTNAIRHGVTFNTPTRGQYDIRMKRLTADTSDDSIRDTIIWSALRSFTNESPVQSSVPVALTAIRIKATDQLNGVIDQFAGYPRKVCLDWDGGTSAWVLRATRNPASLYRYAFQSGAVQAPFGDDKLDLAQLAAWHEFCEAQGFEFNQWRNFSSSFYDVISDIAAAGRAAPASVDGKWSVVIDQPKTPVQHITPRNSRQFQSSKAFLDKPHGIRVQFSNEDEDYATDELVVYLDGYTAETATKFETATKPGITSPVLIGKHTRFDAIVAEQRPEQFTFLQDMERLVYGRGDVILLTHDVILVGLSYGRLKSVQLDDDGDFAIGMTVDAPVLIESGKLYGVSIRTVGNPALTAQIIADIGEQTVLTFAVPIPIADAPSAGDLFGFGLLGSETDEALVIDIDPSGDLYDATITAVPYRDAVYTLDAEDVPPFDSRLTPVDPLPAVVVESARSDESVLTVGPGESLSVHVAVKVQPIDNSLDGRLDVQIRPSTTGEPFANAQVDSIIGNEAMIGDVRTGEYVDIRLRWIVTGRLPGPWSYVNNHRVVGKSTAPAPLTDLTISTYNGQAFLRWDPPAELDVIFGGKVEFRFSGDDSPSWSNSTSIGQAAQARALFATLPLKTGTYLARIFDEAGNQSDVVMVASTQASVLTYTPVDTIDEAPDFAGSKDNVTVDDIALKIGGAGQWDDIPDFDSEPDIDAFGGTSEITTGEYRFDVGFDFGSVKKVRLTTRLISGVFAVNDNIDSWGETIDSRADFDGSNSGEADAVIYMAQTPDDPSGSPTWSDWQRLDSMEVHARGCKFKAVLTSYNHDFNIGITTLGVDAEEVA